MRIMGKKKRILIADDEPGMIQLLKDYFELQDYEVIEASNGLEVLEQLDKDPDIILLDVNMTVRNSSSFPMAGRRNARHPSRCPRAAAVSSPWM